MKSSVWASVCATPRSVPVPLRAVVAARLANYFELTKPRIAALVLLTVTVGFTLASSMGTAAGFDPSRLLHALGGIALVAAGASALNQFLERRTDGLMRRTSERPLPEGRLAPAEALLFGAGTGLAGVAYLAAQVNGTTAALAAVTLLLYVGAYTPSKRRTALCTTIGAVPGAIPPVLGWTAAGGALDGAALALFAILFLWQFPHFLAIGWLYREEYARAGLRMLPAGRPSARIVGLSAVAYALALVPVSLLPSRLALAGDGYALAAIVLGAGYVAAALRFLLRGTPSAARVLLWSSLIYLPLLLSALTWDHLYLLGRVGGR